MVDAEKGWQGKMHQYYKIYNKESRGCRLKVVVPGGWVLVYPRWQRCFQRCTSRGTSQIIEVRIVQFHSNVQNQIKNKSRLIRTNKVRVMQGCRVKIGGDMDSKVVASTSPGALIHQHWCLVHHCIIMVHQVLSKLYSILLAGGCSEIFEVKRVPLDNTASVYIRRYQWVPVSAHV